MDKVTAKKNLLILVLLFVCNFTFAYTKEELFNLPTKQTVFYGGTFSPNLLEKVRVLEGNAAGFIATYDNYFEYKKLCA